MIRATVLLGFILTLVGTAGATTYTVCPDGSGDFTVIEDALGIATAGDVIELCNGVFTGPGNVDLLIESGLNGVTIRSEGGDPDGCIIDCEGLTRAMLINQDVNNTLIIEGITIRNGHYSGHAGGGIYFRISSPTLENCIIENCICDHEDGGGGVYLQGGSPAFIGCIFRDNVAAYGAGMRIYNSQPWTTNPTFEECTFNGNEASDCGGAIHCNEASPVFSNCQFIGNSALENGGAVYHNNGSGSITFETCAFSGNTTTNHHGGAIWTQNYALVSGSSFCNNAAGGGGGGVNIQGSDCQILDSVFFGNSASTGGAIMVTEHSSNAVITGCTVSDNVAPEASGIRVLQPLALHHSIIAYGTGGEAVTCIGSGSLTMSCCDIYSNAGGAGCASALIGQFNNIDLDPLFCSRDCDGFYLCDTSPCAEVCNPNCGQIGARGVGCTAGPMEILYPNGGEDLCAGEPAVILWDVEATPCNGEEISIELLHEGEVCLEIAPAIPLTQGTYEWIAEQYGEEVSGYTIRITDRLTGVAEESDAPFFIRPHYRITRATDVPGDQGGQLRLCWNRADDDQVGTMYTITKYSVWRRIDLYGDEYGRETNAMVGNDPRVYPPGDWEFLLEVPACGEDYYCVICPTVCDSSIAHGQCWSTFFVRAHTEEQLTFFDTEPDSGYSVDNLVPAAPGDLHWEVTNEVLAWEESQEEDFDYYAVYNSDSWLFDPHNATLEPLGVTIETHFGIDECEHLYFHVLAFDYSGNMGEAATIGWWPTDAGDQPARRPNQTMLYQNNPNPLSESTSIRFDLAADGDVRLTILDACGRVMTTLVDGYLKAGQHAVPWSVNLNGRPLSAGIYFYRLQTGDVAQTRQMLIAH